MMEPSRVILRARGLLLRRPMKSAHSRSRTTIAAVLCSALLVLLGLGATLAQTPPTPYGSAALDTGAWQRERKGLSRSPPSPHDLSVAPSEFSFSLDLSSRNQTAINEAAKAAADSA